MNDDFQPQQNGFSDGFSGRFSEGFSGRFSSQFSNEGDATAYDSFHALDHLDSFRMPVRPRPQLNPVFDMLVMSPFLMVLFLLRMIHQCARWLSQLSLTLCFWGAEALHIPKSLVFRRLLRSVGREDFLG